MFRKISECIRDGPTRNLLHRNERIKLDITWKLKKLEHCYIIINKLTGFSVGHAITYIELTFYCSAVEFATLVRYRTKWHSKDNRQCCMKFTVIAPLRTRRVIVVASEERTSRKMDDVTHYFGILLTPVGLNREQFQSDQL